ncbi:16S rRNA (guanine(527)-N(7))-methyltransferase RsmG [Nocardioides caeni]|uniref:Ribosomal RNA small subunit methyltransferase G n=1 Tax=Nocardioides caeni TaxID=574700 RepID=A0A4S8N2H0_9ACTN|nr:16S rRNA (guanine(527)-N(7))-methyltransferase RsmG [Nocardioides caeni]THV10128.1 16S rRNA (guanine(527)-N(7))-methyltransferase RsmG [Nocardioides caeni]
MKQPIDVPPPPPAAAVVFPGDRLVLAEQYAALLAADGVVRGLIGPREAPRLWERHLINCALLGAVLPQDATVADVGSGAGLPGLVLAIARPDLRLTLVEPLLRRTTFLEEVVEALALTNVTVRRDRADALHGEATFDVVTSRAVAPLDRLTSWCLPLVAPHGEMIALKGSSVADEVSPALDVIRGLGGTEPQIEVVPGPEGAGIDAVHIARIRWSDPSRTRVSLRPRDQADRRRSASARSRNKRRKS